MSATENVAGDPAARQLSPLGTFFGSFVGVGYLYVGRIRTQIAFNVGGFALLAVAGWTRWILIPRFLYLLGCVGVALLLQQAIHTAVIAGRSGRVRFERYNRWWFYVLWMLAWGLFADVTVGHRGQIFGYETFWLPSPSMSPTLEVGDYIMVDAWRYVSRPIARGDVVVYEDVTTSNTRLTKRVVAIPGDEVELRGSALLRNGERVSEQYLPAPSTGARVGPDVAPLRLRPGTYYLLGDNRGSSRDSRFHGPVERDHILGRVEYVFYSSDWERFPRRIADDAP